jgi:hypothetical protein
MPREGTGTLFAAPPAPSGKKGVQDLHAGLRKQPIRVVNRPARYPPTGIWPFELRADMVAALLDFETTRQLCRAIAAGSAPKPGSVRGGGSSLEVVWSLEAVRAFVLARHGVEASNTFGRART